MTAFHLLTVSVGWQWLGLSWSGSLGFCLGFQQLQLFGDCLGLHHLRWPNSCLVPQRVVWLGPSPQAFHPSLLHKIVEVFQEGKTQNSGLLRLRSEVTWHVWYILLVKASHRASLDARGREIDFMSWREELQRIWGYITFITKENARSTKRLSWVIREGKKFYVFLRMLFEYVPVPCGCKGAVLNKVSCPCEGCYKRELPERESAWLFPVRYFLAASTTWWIPR